MGKKKIPEEEAEEFRLAMKHVKPIIQDKFFLKKQKKKINREIQQEEQIEYFQLSDHQTEPPVTAEEKLFFVRSGLSPKQIQSLKKGSFPILARLDLHGYDSETARHELSRFIQLSFLKNKRSVLIVHGKGHISQPVLKNKINNWLRQIDVVLGFSTAPPRQGGTGALYVLLKSRKKIDDL